MLFFPLDCEVLIKFPVLTVPRDLSSTTGAGDWASSIVVSENCALFLLMVDLFGRLIAASSLIKPGCFVLWEPANDNKFHYWGCALSPKQVLLLWNKLQEQIV